MKSIEREITNKGIKDIKSLLNICNETDGTKFSLYLKERKDDSIKDFLYYEDNILVGYLVIYPSYVKGQVQLTGMVHPDSRRKGIFTELVNQAKDTIKKEGKSIIRFICDHNSKDGKSFIESISAKYANSSYTMEYQNASVDIDSKLSITQATLDDLDELVKIGVEAFETLEEEERPLVKENIESKDRRLVVGRFNNVIIGCVLATLDDGKAHIGDLAVKKEFRKRGFGRELLYRAIQDVLTQGVNYIDLSVHTDNLNALSLYKDAGFEVVNATDYYLLTI